VLLLLLLLHLRDLCWPAWKDHSLLLLLRIQVQEGLLSPGLAACCVLSAQPASHHLMLQQLLVAAAADVCRAAS
jgi:hypothetical protein